MFLDGPDAKARDAVHVVFAEERVREEYVEPAPGVDQIDRTDQFRVLSLEALVTMKLTSFRRKDQVHLLDLRDVGLIDEQWCDRYSEPLAERLRELLSDPNE